MVIKTVNTVLILTRFILLSNNSVDYINYDKFGYFMCVICGFLKIVCPYIADQCKHLNKLRFRSNPNSFLLEKNMNLFFSSD